MANYVLAYTGGGTPDSEAEQAAQLAAWTAWFEALGESVVDAGNPFAGSKTVISEGSVSESGASGLTGYSILVADDLDAAASVAAGCPIIGNGGSVEVYETLPIM